MWILPILLLGAIGAVAASKSPRETVSPSRQLSPPGPISVLGEILRIGQVPPPRVILCAIAEAETIGRSDLVSDIVRAFVAPAVYQQQMLSCRRTALPYERGSCAQGQVWRGRDDHPRGSCALPPHADASSTPSVPMPPAAVQLPPRPATQEDILAMLHADPRAFLTMMSSRQPTVIDVPIDAPQAPTVASQAPAAVIGGDISASSVDLPSSSSMGFETGAQRQESDQAGVFAPGSALGGVSDDAWRAFVVRLEREAPTFSSSRHVGQYRQRRERLAELGISPSALHGSASAQRAALDADLVDAHGHALAGGLISEHLGRAITIPGHDGAERITLSGLLGVVQCAGLEGAVGWLERPNDRKRYPHTTQAFLHTNRIF